MGKNLVTGNMVGENLWFFARIFVSCRTLLRNILWILLIRKKLPPYQFNLNQRRFLSPFITRFLLQRLHRTINWQFDIVRSENKAHCKNTAQQKAFKETNILIQSHFKEYSPVAVSPRTDFRGHSDNKDPSYKHTMSPEQGGPRNKLFYRLH